MFVCYALDERLRIFVVRKKRKTATVDVSQMFSLLTNPWRRRTYTFRTRIPRPEPVGFEKLEIKFNGYCGALYPSQCVLLSLRRTREIARGPINHYIYIYIYIYIHRHQMCAVTMYIICFRSVTPIQHTAVQSIVHCHFPDNRVGRRYTNVLVEKNITITYRFVSENLKCLILT
jgi:hypothetical protein